MTKNQMLDRYGRSALAGTIEKRTLDKCIGTAGKRRLCPNAGAKASSTHIPEAAS